MPAEDRTGGKAFANQLQLLRPSTLLFTISRRHETGGPYAGTPLSISQGRLGSTKSWKRLTHFVNRAIFHRLPTWK